MNNDNALVTVGILSTYLPIVDLVEFIFSPNSFKVKLFEVLSWFRHFAKISSKSIKPPFGSIRIEYYNKDVVFRQNTE